jgi:hypothetical protein
MREHWRATKYPGYEVSSLGRVRSVDRVVRGRRFKGKTLTPSLAGGAQSKRYLCVTPSVDNKKVTVAVHILVLEAFGGPRPSERSCGLHRDDNVHNNHVDNLYWGTHSENEFDKVKNGNHTNANKVRCPRGHILAHPNLDQWSLINEEQRKCLACSRARAYFRNVSDRFPIEVLADDYYTEILRGV